MILSNAYFLAKFRFDTAENEPAKHLQKIAEIAKRKQVFLFSWLSSPSTGDGTALEKLADLASPGGLLDSWRSAVVLVIASIEFVGQIFGKMPLVFGCIGTDLCK